MATKTTKRFADLLKQAEGWTATTRYPFEVKDGKGETIGTLYFRPLTKAVRKKIAALIQPKEGEKVSESDQFADFNTYALIQLAENEDGSPAFSLGDFDFLTREANSTFLAQIENFMFNAGVRSIEDEKKTSDPTPTDDSPSS